MVFDIQVRLHAMLQRLYIWSHVSPHLLVLMRHKHLARCLAVLEHVGGSSVEERKEDVVGAENQSLVLR